MLDISLVKFIRKPRFSYADLYIYALPSSTRHCKCRPLYYPFYGLKCDSPHTKNANAFFYVGHHADCKCPLNCRGGPTCLYNSLDELLLVHCDDDNYDSPHTKNAPAFFDVGHQFCKVHTKTQFSCADLHNYDNIKPILKNIVEN
jgi:hypothetical protein